MMRKIMSAALAVLLLFSLFPFTAAAAEIIGSGTCGETVSWTLDRDGLLTISGSGRITYCSWLENDLVKQQAKTAVFAEGITAIGVGGGMFCECTALTRVVIPASMTGQLNAGDFIMATALETIEVSPDNPIMTSVDGVLYTKDLSTIIKYPAAKSGAFTIPDGVETIVDGAFMNCSALTTLTLPASVTTVGNGPFESDSLTAILVAPDNASFTSVDGVLFTKDLMELVGFPYAKCASYTVPDGVTSIRGSAFRSCMGLESIVLPDGLTSIGSIAFMDCWELKEVTIPASVTKFDFHTFSGDWALADVWYGGTKAQWKAIERCEGNDSLTSAVIHCTDGIVDPNAVEPASGQCGENVFWDLDENGVLTIHGTGPMTNYDWMQNSPFFDNKGIRSVIIEPGVTSIGDFAFLFYNVSNIRSISIPASVTYIGSNALCGCQNLESVTIPEHVETIGWGAFARCAELKTVTIPASVTSIGEAAFVDCHSLAEILVAPENPAYSSLDGVLFNKDRTMLLEYPSAKHADYTIPDGVVQIASRAFEDLEGLTSLVVPEGVERIENGTFCGCWNMKSITLPSSLTFIGERAFTYDHSLADVYFLGTQAQWNAVQIESNNDSLSNATVHCLGVEPFDPIVSQPADQTVPLKANAVFSVQAEGTDLTYRWQYCKSGKTTWYDSSFEGCDTNALTVQATAGRDGQRYRCVITDADGSEAISAPATLTVGPEQASIRITDQPADQTVPLKASAVFSVQAEGMGLTYRWQYSKPGKPTWWYDSSFEGCDTIALTVQATAGRDGQRYRCVITDANGSEVISEPAALTVGPAARITVQPADQLVPMNADAVFSVQAEGTGLTYQWQYCQPGKTMWYDSGADGANTSELRIPATVRRDGQRYRCIITDAGGNKVISEPATLHVG